jgi:hypothetical protein
MPDNLPQLDLFEMVPADPPIRDYQDCMVLAYPVDSHTR